MPNEWINKLKRDLQGFEERPESEIHIDSLRSILRKMPNWKSQSHDGIHGYWFKKITSIHERMAQQLNKCLQEANIPEWMTKGKSTLIQKDTRKGTIPSNYRPITCLPIMWKILTAQIKEDIYYSLDC